MTIRRFISALSALAIGSLVLSSAGLPARVLAAPGPQAGTVSIHKMGGDIEVPDAPNGADVATMGGNIHIGNVAHSASAKTMGGEIVIDHAACPVNAATMAGNVEIRQAAGSIHASTMAGEVRAHLTGTSEIPREVKLSSMAGSILLTVPKQFGMDVHIKLTYTKNSPQNFRVIQHLGLTEREATEWDASSGTPRKYIYVSGRVGNGANQVTIDTINGDVVLKQE